jgi:peptidoglycan/xylan/chitin deacetylase (PgdA/CDA1 family)
VGATNVIGDPGRALLLSFDNLGEAADLERAPEPEPEPSGDHPSVTEALPRLLERLAALELRATFFVEAINAELYPEALRDIAAAGHEVGMHGWRHERWDALTGAEEVELLERGLHALRGLGLEVEGFRPPGGALGPRSAGALAARGIHWCSPEGTYSRRANGLACLPFRWQLVDAYHRMESFAERRVRLGDGARAASPREAADALLEALDAPADGPLVVILHPFLMLRPSEIAESDRVLARLAELAAQGRRWIAPGREIAGALGAGVSSARG